MNGLDLAKENGLITAAAYVIDKSKWPRGLWDDELDYLEWTDEATGLPCRMIRNDHGGFWLGYVAVTADHPYFQKEYGSEGPISLDVHVELTFSGGFPDRPDSQWWFGFDCGHLWDCKPGRSDEAVFFERGRQSYCTQDYVKSEVTKLACQLKDVDVNLITQEAE